MLQGLQLSQWNQQLESKLITASDKRLSEILEVYSNEMRANGIPYGNLAYQALRANTFKREIIRYYLEALFQQVGVELINPFLFDKLTRLLVQTHIMYRQVSQENSLKLETIQNYHFKLFEEFAGVPREAWEYTIFSKPFGRMMWSMNEELLDDIFDATALSKYTNHFRGDDSDKIRSQSIKSLRFNQYKETSQFLEALFYTDPLLKKAFLKANPKKSLVFLRKIGNLLSNGALNVQWEAIVKQYGASDFLNSLWAECLHGIEEEKNIVIEPTQFSTEAIHMIGINSSYKCQLFRMLIDDPVFYMGNFFKEIKILDLTKVSESKSIVKEEVETKKSFRKPGDQLKCDANALSLLSINLPLSDENSFIQKIIKPLIKSETDAELQLPLATDVVEKAFHAVNGFFSTPKVTSTYTNFPLLPTLNP